ncbi:peptidase inhibitor family I36 protein [Streptomyces olivoreticuli]
MSKRGFLVSAMVVLSVVASSAAAVAPASADSCIDGHFCLYFNSNGDGAFTRASGNIPDLAGMTFDACGRSCKGLGQPVKNNAASARNTNDWFMAKVFYHSNYKGAFDFIDTNTLRNLENTKNENASVLFWDR